MQRKSKFALEDDDDEPTELLTHGGNALSTFDDFKDNISIEDDDDDAGCTAFATWNLLSNFLYHFDMPTDFVTTRELTVLAFCAAVNAEIVRDLHFGGGFAEKSSGGDGDERDGKVDLHLYMFPLPFVNQDFIFLNHITIFY